MDIKKIIAKLPTGFAEDAASWNEQQLRDAIITAETNLRTVTQEMKADEKLTGARELVKDYSAAYNEAKKAQRAKIDYSLHVLEERGKLGVGAVEETTETVDARALANDAQGRASRLG